MDRAKALEVAIECMELERDNLYDAAMEVILWNSNRPPRGELRRKHDEYFEILQALKVISIMLSSERQRESDT